MTANLPPANPLGGVPAYLAGRRPTQVAILVPDLRLGIQTWSALLGIGDEEWRIHSYSSDNVDRLTCRGSVEPFSFRLAMTGQGPQFELVQPISGQSIYTEWIAEHGHGIHHLGFHVESIDEGIAALRKEGHEPIQTGFGYGADGDGGFAYYELPAFGDLVVEIIEVPATRRPSEQL